MPRTLLLLCLASLTASVSAAQTPRKVPPSNPQLASPAIEQRAETILKQMTLEEKLGQLVQYNDQGVMADTAAGAQANIAANPEASYKLDPLQLAATGRMGSMLNTIGAEHTSLFQRAAVEKSRLHIPLLFGADVIHGYKTIYPVPLGLAASFDPSLVEQVSRMAAEEATTAGIRWFYSPMVDVSRDARWGRVVESAGEDPFLGAQIARAYVRGYQGDDLSQPDAVAASVKHFAAYGAAEAGREYNTTDMSESRLRQVYLPTYKAAVEAGAATIMSAFNSLNGVPATANGYLLNSILRGEWGFDGVVVSDYTAIMELMHHGIALDAATATEKALHAGVDIDMMSHFYDTELPALIRSGRVPMAEVDEAVLRVLRLKIALGLFEHPYARATEVTGAVEAHRPLVRHAAEESFVLLRNEGGLLPLSSSERIALIGPLADDAHDMQGAWGGARMDSETVTLKAALEQRARSNGTTLAYARGTDIQGTSTAGFTAAINAARSSDVVVMALGESADMSGEAASRAHLDLPGNQEQLLEAVAAAGKPIVLLVFSGRPLVLDWAAAHIPAILEAWFPGTEAGSALARTLYGDVSPSGKLPMSFPQAVGQEPLYYNQFPTGRPPAGADLNVPPTDSTKFISRYIDVPNAALFPFGYGLSYTTFSYVKPTVSRATIPLKEAEAGEHTVLLNVTTTVTNTGKRTGTEVVQCYVGNVGASLEQPVRSLKGFTRITLKPGESRQVVFPLTRHELSFFDNNGRELIEPTDYTVWVGGSSLAEESAQFDIR